MQRREFIKNAAFLTAAQGVLLPNLVKGSQESRDVLRGFIVSDAHFGWVKNVKAEFQRTIMDRIVARFPDLDVFFDTGDAHHNDHHDNVDPYKARADWVDIIPGRCGCAPFYYVMGNHEVYSNEDADAELRCNKMGSVSCRPYYSFDLYGIHFISFPELVKTVNLTEEEFDWLELDLAVNRDKTTILLSHNNIVNTTKGNAAGYRGLMDSQRMLEIFSRYPNVVSWMHGHNHNYQIVNKQNMLFVSNGRIGGFDPSRGKHGIGGIYFEVSRDALNVRCYSAEKNMFLDKLDSSLSQKIIVKTSLDMKSPPSYTYGVGGAKDGERVIAWHHHTGKDVQAEFFATGTSEKAINEDTGMTKYVERTAWHGLDKQLMAASVSHGNAGYDYLDPGIRLKANNNWWTSVVMPADYFSEFTYYRCPPNREYRVSIELDAMSGSQVLWLRLHVRDNEGRHLRIVQSPPFTLKKGKQLLECTLKVPALDEYDTVYSNNRSEKLVNMAIEASFSKMIDDVDVTNFNFSFADAKGPTSDPGVLINGKEFIYKGEVAKGKIIRLDIPADYSDRSMCELKAKGSGRLTYLIRRTNLDWQVRNAAVTDRGSYLEIDQMRNDLSDKMEIIIVPMTKTQAPFIHRIRKAEKIRLYPLNRGNSVLQVDIQKITEKTEVDVVSFRKPQKVTGVKSWNYSDNLITAKISSPGIMKIYY